MKLSLTNAMKPHLSRHSCLLVFAMVVILGASVTSRAEVEKFATPVADGMRLYWWPKVPAVEGWIQDQDASVANAIFALVPVGQSFSDAPVVIYAKAVFKARVSNLQSLAAFVDDDKKATLSHAPGTSVVPARTMTDGDGRDLVSFLFQPGGEGDWERVSYMEEGEFYLIFAVSARSESALKSAQGSYEWLVSHYKEHP